jgi:hypothetical protein
VAAEGKRLTSPTSAITSRAMKEPTPGMRVRAETRELLCAHARISRFTAVSSRSKSAISASRLSSRRRVGSSNASSPRKCRPPQAEQLGAPLLDALTGKERMHAGLEAVAKASESNVVTSSSRNSRSSGGGDVGLGEEISAQHMGQRACVDGVRLHPRGGDRPRVPANEQDGARSAEPQAGLAATPNQNRLEGRPRIPSQLGEDRAQGVRVIRHPTREQLEPALIESSNMRAPAVQVDADVDHGGLLSL